MKSFLVLFVLASALSASEFLSTLNSRRLSGYHGHGHGHKDRHCKECKQHLADCRE